MQRRLIPIALLGVAMSAFAGPASSLDPQFFARNVTYEMVGERVALMGPGPTVTSVDDWGQLVFLAADGEHTVGELIAQLAGKYPNGIPRELPEQVRHIVREMAKAGFLTLAANRAPLPYYLSMPMQKQDVQRSKRLMEADGFIKRAAK